MINWEKLDTEIDKKRVGSQLRVSTTLSTVYESPKKFFGQRIKERVYQNLVKVKERKKQREKF